jgi:prephenate dehydrogenase
VRWKKVTLVGVGLLGGSLGLALKNRRLAEQVVGFVRRSQSVSECLEKGAVDSATLSLEEAVAESDLVVLCTPILQMSSLAKQIQPVLRPGAIVTDVGSVKESVTRDLEQILQHGPCHFVGSHPMAGAEKTGVLFARANLFAESVCVVTPTPNTHAQALEQIEQLWKDVGGRVLRLSPAAHDILVSRSSHLPHVVAAQLANLVLDPNHPKEQSSLCANGFRDTTRIASGSPEMWRDIALANGPNLAQALDQFIDGLKKLRSALAAKDEAAIADFFQDAKLKRDAWSRQAQSHSPE